jgi:hypothetical protein
MTRRIDKTRVTTLLTALVELYDASAEFCAQLPATPRTPQGRRWVVAIEALDELFVDATQSVADDIEAWSVATAEPTGTRCSVCGEPQLRSPSGDTCRNGHGGAPPLENGQRPTEAT